MQNALTIDLEDWFHVCDAEKFLPRAKWDSFENRISIGTNEILELLKKYDHKATFFVLAYIAERDPSLVRKIQDAGHEIASHGYQHLKVSKLTPEEFEDDLKTSIDIIEDITKEKILGYRAPEWSINEKTQWALELIKKNGLKYDSSILPTFFYGGNNYNPLPHKIETDYGELFEFPATTNLFFGLRYPIGGGIGLRISTYYHALQRSLKISRTKNPLMVYLHPWEFDTSHPYVKFPPLLSFSHYFKLSSTKKKAEAFLNRFKFAPVKIVLSSLFKNLRKE